MTLDSDIFDSLFHSAALAAYPLPVLKSALCQRVPFAESATQGLTVYELDPEMLASREMSDLADEVMEVLA